MVNRYAFVEPTASKVTVAPSASADKFTNANKEFFATVGAASWVNFTNKTMISLHLYSNSRPSFEPVKPWNHKFYSDCYRRPATDSMWTHSKYMWSPHPSNPIEPMAPETVWSPANFPSYLIFDFCLSSKDSNFVSQNSAHATSIVKQEKHVHLAFVYIDRKIIFLSPNSW